jgi:hypothetical protein
MLKIVAAGATALFVTASSFAYAQAPSAGARERLTAADVGALTDARIRAFSARLESRRIPKGLSMSESAALIRFGGKKCRSRIRTTCEYE